MQSEKAGTELHGIEILRFLAALAILVWHYQHFFFTAAYNPDVAQQMRSGFPFYRVLELFYENGLYAVQVFWVISGFVFMRRYYEVIAAGAMGFEAFAIRRFSRLYPLHIVALVAVALLQDRYLATHGTYFIYQDNSLPDLIGQVLMASNWFATQPQSFNGPIWSVSVELLVYGLFFVVARPSAFAALATPTHRLAAYAMLLLIFTTALPVVHYYVLVCGLFFLCGALAERGLRHAAALPVASAVLILLAAGLAAGFMKPQTWLVLMFGVAATIVAARLDGLVPNGVLKLPAALGNATYSSYLLHFPVQVGAVLIVDRLGWSREVFLNPFVFLAYILGVFGAALLTYHLFEMPAQHFLRSRASARSTEPKVVPAE